MCEDLTIVCPEFCETAMIMLAYFETNTKKWKENRSDWANCEKGSDDKGKRLVMVRLHTLAVLMAGVMRGYGIRKSSVLKSKSLESKIEQNAAVYEAGKRVGRAIPKQSSKDVWENMIKILRGCKVGNEEQYVKLLNTLDTAKRSEEKRRAEKI